ncbi:MAG: YdcF family protein [Coriobacteriaceae bacterium]|jgi:vancomycin permeability regulator SanA|nr:YdcF family protein [Coriobacteriaceae bacterium]
MLWIFLGLLALGAVGVAGTNAAVIGVGGSKFVSPDDAVEHDAQCILVLGASVLPDGTPSGILQDRLDVAIRLYEAGAAPKMIMSGDNGTASYNEVQAMKAYAVAQGVPSEDIFCDHAGFSTYESMYRAANLFGVERMVVVTQSYHLYRALYAANGLGIDAVGVPSDVRSYQQQLWFDLREVFARSKDFFQTLLKLPSAMGGAAISLDQSGDVTELGR